LWSFREYTGHFAKTPPQKVVECMNRMDIISKEKEIKKEKNRLKRIFKDLDKNKKEASIGLIDEAAFMRITLQDLKDDINTNGVIDEMPQGDYTIFRESPTVKTYNTMIQRYTAACKELNNLLPKDNPRIKDDGFEEFVMNK
jgi:hypothetical protein